MGVTRTPVQALRVRCTVARLQRERERLLVWLLPVQEDNLDDALGPLRVECDPARVPAVLQRKGAVVCVMIEPSAGEAGEEGTA